MIEIGRYNTLPVLSLQGPGALLGTEQERAFLPQRELPEGTTEGQTLRVFVYTTPEGLAATTAEPKATLGDFAFMKVVDLNDYGAFVDWGLPKDLLVPFGNQYGPMQVGRRYVVGVRLHERTQRLVGSTVMAGMFDDDVSTLREGDAVDLMVYGETERGTQVIVNRRHAGLVYHNQAFRRLRPGDELKGWVAVVRDDHRLDITLQRPGREGMDDACVTILEALDAAGGQLPLHDKSPPAAIARSLNMSKKVFKKTVGRLYRNRLIELMDGGIRKISSPGRPSHSPPPPAAPAPRSEDSAGPGGGSGG